MLGALRLMTVERGIDPRGFALMPFGGAGPLHAAALASELGISRVLCPRTSGVLCALGLAAAAPRRDVARTVVLSGRSLSMERLNRERTALLAEATAALAQEPARVRVRHELRYRGQAFELPVEQELAAAGDRRGMGPQELRAAFARAHELHYGYSDESTEVELVNIRLSVWGPAPSLRPRAVEAATQTAESRPIVFAGEQLPAAVLRGAPAPGTLLQGPALCALPEATLLIPPGWSGEVDGHGTVHLDHGQED